MLISGIPYIAQHDLADVWRKYGGGYVWIKDINKKINALWYVLKYVNKTIQGQDIVYSALLFASNKRMFSMSQSLLTKLKIRRKRGSQGWKFIGTADVLQLKSLCMEENIFFDDFIKIKADYALMHKFPLVFGICDDG